MLKKYWKWIVGLTAIVGGSIIFLLLMENITIRVEPESLEKIDVDEQHFKDLVTIRNGELIRIDVVDQNQQVVKQRMLGKQYYLNVNVSGNGKSQIIQIPITFADYTPPSYKVIADPVELNYGEDIEWKQLITASDNYDVSVNVSLDLSTFDNQDTETIQTIKGVISDQSGNAIAMQVNVKVKQPQCALDAYWNGSDCQCNQGYIGDGWRACIASATSDKKITQQVQVQQNINNGTNEAVEPSVNNNSNDASQEVEGENSFPSWGFNIKDQSYDQSISSGSRCDQDGNNGVGRPDNAVGWACMMHDGQYHLTYFDANDQIVAQIGGY